MGLDGACSLSALVLHLGFRPRESAITEQYLQKAHLKILGLRNPWVEDANTTRAKKALFSQTIISSGKHNFLEHMHQPAKGAFQFSNLVSNMIGLRFLKLELNIYATHALVGFVDLWIPVLN